MPINPTVPKDLGKLIISCWKANPKHRPDFADILKSLSSSSAKINKITFSTPKSIHHEKSTMPPQRFLSLRKFTKRTYILVAILFFLLIVAAVAVCVIIAANSNRRDLLDTFTASTSIISTTVAAGSLHTNPSTSNSLNSALTTASSAFTPDLGITSIPYCSTLSDVTGISPFSHVDSSTDIASTPINSGSTSAVETSTSSPVASTSDFASTPITSGSTNTDVETSTFSPVDSSTDIATTPITSGSTSAVETSTFSPVVSTSDFTSTPITSGSTNTDIEISTFSPVDSTSDIASTPITSGSTTTGVETSTSSPVDATSDIVDTLFTSTTSSEDTSNFSTLNSEIPSTDIQTDSITSSSILIESPTTTTTDPVSTTTTSVLYTTATIVSTLAGGAFDPAVLGFDGYGASVSFDKPYAIAYRRSDDMIFLSEFDAARIRTINGSGYVSTIIRNSSTIKDGPLASASFGEPFGITVNTSGNLFVSDRFGSIRVVNDTTVYTIAGNLVKDSSPDVVNPNAVTFDGAGNVYWAQEAGKIQKLSPSGTIWTLTSLFQKPRGLVFDPSTNVFYISDNHYIKNMTLDGTISIMCGSTSSGFVNDVGLNARFSGMNGLALDGKGNLIIADTNNNAVRSMNIATLNVTTIAGNRTAGMNNGFANISTFNGLRAVAVDQNGDILVSDFRSNVVRKISFVKIPI